MRRAVTAEDVTGPALRGVPQKVIDAAWKYARLLGVPVIPSIAIRNHLSSGWLGRCHFRLHESGTRLNLMEIQKRTMHDERTLDRVIAHEMCHHAEFLAFTEKDIVLLKAGVRRTSHGAPWQRFADKVNRVMGKDYVTVVSDASVVLAPETKPFLLLIAEIRPGRLGFSVSVRITHKVKETLWRYSKLGMGARILSSKDPRWAKGPKIGPGMLAVPIKPEDKQDLQALFDTASPISTP